MLATNQAHKIIEILKPYQPQRISVFGSFSRGDNRKDSDIDILYRFAKPISFFQKFDIQNALENSLNAKVDLVSEDYMHADFAQEVQKDLRIIYEAKP